MVSNELSEALRKLELTFNKKIEEMISINSHSFFNSQNDSLPRNVEASNLVNAAPPGDGENGGFFSRVRNRFFGG